MPRSAAHADTLGTREGVAITATAVNRTFASPNGSTFTALHDVALDITAGEFVAVVGPSGCGKTTLLRIVMGLEQPSSGEVTFDAGGDVVTRSFVFQQSSLLPWRTVEDNIAFGLELQCRRDQRATGEERMTELLELTGLSQFRDYYPSQLSGGMQQRVNLARALAIDPNVLLMDEPFSALDAMTKEHLQRELTAIAAHLRATVLFVTHDIREAVFLADRVVVMATHLGRIVETVRVDAPEMRDEEFQRSPELAEQAREIWAMLGHAQRPSADRTSA